jgi:ATP-dependent exoDNAse (exonuclease V) beta subunit
MLEGTLTLTWEDDDCGHMGLENILLQAKKAHRQKKTDAADIGTRVHEVIQAWVESDGKLDPAEVCPTLFYNLFKSKTADLTPEMILNAQARQGLEAFIAWGEFHDVHVLAWEEVVSDGEYYAGRYDMLATIDGNVTLLDFKTSTGIWDEYWVQVNAYALCLQHTATPPTHVAILRIDKKTGGIEYVVQETSERLQNAFKCLSLYYHFAVTQKGGK